MHTPGPWDIRRSTRPVDGAYDWAIGAEIDDGGPYCIAEAVGRAAEDVWLPAEANARLIASAPDLLEALEGLRKTAQLLFDNAVGCAVNHHSLDFEQQGLPGWLVDAEAEIKAVSTAIAKARKP